MTNPFYVLILGSGSAIPKKNKNHTSQLVVHNGVQILVDCGESSQIQLKKFGGSLQKIDHILISHLHGDHYLGLPGLISTMSLLGREKDLIISGPKELRELIDLHFKISKSRCSYRIHYQETQSSTKQLLFKEGDLSVYSFPLKHKIKTTGFLFVSLSDKRKLLAHKLEEHNVPKHLRQGIAKGRDYTNDEGDLILNTELTEDPANSRSYAYCSDTAFKPAIKDFVGKVNLMYHEASFMNKDGDKAKERTHSTTGQAAEIASMCNANRLLIGHFSSKYEDDTLLVDEARTIFKNTEAAVEGMQYEVL